MPTNHNLYWKLNACARRCPASNFRVHKRHDLCTTHKSDPSHTASSRVKRNVARTVQNVSPAEPQRTTPDCPKLVPVSVMTGKKNTLMSKWTTKPRRRATSVPLHACTRQDFFSYAPSPPCVVPLLGTIELIWGGKYEKVPVLILTWPETVTVTSRSLPCSRTKRVCQSGRSTDKRFERVQQMHQANLAGLCAASDGRVVVRVWDTGVCAQDNGTTDACNHKGMNNTKQQTSQVNNTKYQSSGHEW